MKRGQILIKLTWDQLFDLHELIKLSWALKGRTRVGNFKFGKSGNTIKYDDKYAIITFQKKDEIKDG